MLKFNVFFVIIFSIILVGCSKEEFSGTEEEQITAYIAKKGLKVTETTTTGLRYIQTMANPTGASLKSGQSITVRYAGRLLNDTKFDSGDYSFVLGGGRTIKGFDQGVAKMRVGEKATLVFPSSLGYGASGSGSDIPGNAPLVFDMEILSAK